ncbi:acetylglutamate kinase [Taylorella equigenitalis]|uniref:acetylglutamate kinase n=1 Tax=Taylorella equigenitalis TaxID=29575 RepID=UPI000BAC59B8|nr:acetylglutamate kinase [Taylorella equigenitalis]ASY42954.1 acetylglutamate kinase [Taylorella equigenitalis]WDU49367.1 acetylglutamate kinase [Taylorella equigenitalis]
MLKLSIIKIGGNVINNPSELDDFLDKFSCIDGPKILVHGGGVLATELAQSLGIETEMIGGRRVTSKEMLRVAVMTYAGWINKTIVAKLQAKGTNAIGLCGADGGIIRTQRRESKPVDYGFVGDLTPDSINHEPLIKMLETKFVPVISAITHDGNGQLLNTNADTIAGSIATKMASSAEIKTRLVFCFDKIGVLRNVQDDSTLIDRMSHSDYEQLKLKGTIYDGMIPKLDNAFRAIEAGVSEVVIQHSSKIGSDIGTVLY